jgi:tetraacyldisaccharide 4'-kinase
LLAICLWPLSLLFGMVVGLRRWLFRLGWFKVAHLPVPVIVVGNITVGGVGKTPLVIALVEQLRQHGRQPGVISRGYRRSGQAASLAVTEATDAALCGDEPLLIRQRTGAPVFVGRDRAVAATALLAAHPQVDLLISDDGLQHYRLSRQIELAVCDARGWMNRWLLPAGPLREPLSRLAEVTAVIGNAIAVPPAPTFDRPFFRMELVPGLFYRLGSTDGTECLDATSLCQRYPQQRFHAVAGIGDPQRFFTTLTQLGLVAQAHGFPDHHAYQPGDLQFVGDAILTTEKDAVKFRAFGQLTLPVWVLPIDARLTPDLATFVLEKLDGRSPA